MNIRKLTLIGVLSALSAVLYSFTEVPVIPAFPFLKLEISTLPALIGGFAFGPVAGTVIVVIKNLLHLLVTPNFGSPIGELADLIVSLSLVIPAALIYKYHKAFKGALIGLASGLIIMVLMALLCNYLIFIPAFMPAWTWEQTKHYLLAGALPFNAIKGGALVVSALLVYKPLSHVLRRFEQAPKKR